MRSISHSEDFCAKDKLRSEINSQVQEFLHRGGRIEVLGTGAQANTCSRFYGKPASIDEMGLHSLDFE